MYVIIHQSLGTDSKDGYILPKAFASAVSLWHKQAMEISYKKCRFVTCTFTRCLRIAMYSPTLVISFLLPFYSLASARDFTYQALWRLSCNLKWHRPRNDVTCPPHEQSYTRRRWEGLRERRDVTKIKKSNPYLTISSVVILSRSQTKATVPNNSRGVGGEGRRTRRWGDTPTAFLRACHCCNSRL